MARNIVPRIDKGADLGTPEKNWNRLYVDTVIANNVQGGNLGAVEQSASSEATLRSIITNAGGDLVSITIYDDIPIATSFTIPSNVHLNFKDDGRLSPTDGIALIIEGNICAGPWQIFGVNGTIELYNQVFTYPEWFGAKHDGITDDTIALQKCADSTKEGTIILSVGEYIVNSQITIPKDVNLIGQGMDVSIINADGATGIFPDRAVVYNAGYISPMSASLGLTINKGTTVITFDSSHGLSAGDVFFVYNPTDFSWSGSRWYYKAGEYYQVLSVISDTEVNITSPSYDTYQYTDVDVYKLNGTRSILKNFTIIAPGPGVNGIVRGVAVDYSHNALIENVKALNSDNATMSLSHSYESSIKNAVCIQTTQDPGFGTQYGLSIGNSQNCDIQGFFVGVRHGLTLGGGAEIPACTNRGILIHDSICKNQHPYLTACGMHGNTENCTVDNVNCFVGGVNLAGHNNKHRNINIYLGSSRTDSTAYIAIQATEMKSTQHEFSNINIVVPGVLTNPTRGLIDVGGNSIPMDNIQTTIGGTLVFNNINIDAPLWDTVGTFSTMEIRNRGATVKWGVVVNGFTSNCKNTSGSPSYACIAIGTVSGTSPDFVHLSNITYGDRKPLYLGSNDKNVKVRGLRTSGKISIPVTSSQTYANQTVTFPFVFPKAPYVVAQVKGMASGAAVIVSYVSRIEEDYANIGVKTTDLNITFANETLDVYWIATLDED